MDKCKNCHHNHCSEKCYLMQDKELSTITIPSPQPETPNWAKIMGQE